MYAVCGKNAVSLKMALRSWSMNIGNLYLAARPSITCVNMRSSSLPTVTFGVTGRHVY